MSRIPRTIMSYLNYLYLWITIESESEHVTVIKLVVLVLRIPEQIGLHFYGFSMILYGI